ncbi:DsbA family oxidoreductase (plasmid) [Pseudoalteromonas espejiana]
MVNTKDAHTLLEYAANTGKQAQLKALFNAFFTQQQDISKRDVLNKIAQI